METEKTLILDQLQIKHRVNRIAYQIYEDSFDEKEIIIAGLSPGGYKFAKKIAEALQEISPIKVTLVEVKLDKDNPFKGKIEFSVPMESLSHKTVILVDDVLNSGKTLIYSMRPLLELPLKKLRTVVLVDRNHNNYPVRADFTGSSLATTLQEHISVELGGKEETVYLS